MYRLFWDSVYNTLMIIHQNVHVPHANMIS